MNESYNKGKVFEQKVAALIRKKTGQMAQRDSRSGANWHKRSDIVTQLPIHIECKSHENVRIKEWYDQATQGSSFMQTPVVVYQDGELVMAAMEFSNLLNFLVEIADLKAEIADLREAKEVIIEKNIVRKEIDADAAILAHSERFKNSIQTKLCPNGHIVNNYSGKCMAKGCKFSVTYVKPKGKKKK